MTSSYNKNTLQYHLDMIKKAPEIEAYWKERNKDPKHIHRYYDRNKACRICYQTLLGNAKGTCEAESRERFLALANHRTQALLRLEMKAPTPSGKIYHNVLVYYEDKEWRYESYSNGSHMDWRVEDKIKAQPWLWFQIIFATPCFDKKRFNKFVKNVVEERGGFVTKAGELTKKVKKIKTRRVRRGKKGRNCR